MRLCVEIEGNRPFFEEILMEPNLQNDSLIAQQLVYDMVRQSGGVLNVPLTKD